MDVFACNTVHAILFMVFSIRIVCYTFVSSYQKIAAFWFYLYENSKTICHLSSMIVLSIFALDFVYFF